MQWLVRYFVQISVQKAILWCYLIWYLVIVYFYFDPTVQIWINALGISAVIGTGLLLSVSSDNRFKQDNWQTFRLYLMPFCVSSFSALIKAERFIIVLSPKIMENLVALSYCFLFLIVVFSLKLVSNRNV